MTGRALRSIRLALSLTLDEFSDRTGIPALELDACEKGENAIESPRLSRALELLTPDVQQLERENPLLHIPAGPLLTHVDS